MPKAAQHHALARQWEILRLMPGRAPGITARDLALKLRDTGFPVTKRTVERDLVELSSVFGIECNDKGMPYGWHWMRGQEAMLPGVSVADAVSMRLVEELLRPLLPPAVLEPLESRFEQARRKMSELGGDNTAVRWADKVRYVPPSLPMLTPAIDPAVLDTVQQALMDGRALRVSYRRPSGDVAEGMPLHPQALVQRGSVTYLVATAYDYDDPRLYAVHRMVKAEAALDACRAAPGFTLDAYLASGALQFHAGATIRLEAHVSGNLGAILAETPLGPDQQLTDAPDGYRLSVTVIDSRQLLWWILSQGTAIRVLGPAALVAQMTCHAQSMAGLYGDGPATGDG